MPQYHKEEIFTPDEVEKRKKVIFDSMGKRGQKQILKNGYDEWDPFEEPYEPVDIRVDVTQRTSQELIRAFLQSVEHDGYSNEYGEGAFEVCLGIINGKEKHKGIYDFCVWYSNQLEAEGKSVPTVEKIPMDSRLK